MISEKLEKILYRYFLVHSNITVGSFSKYKVQICKAEWCNSVQVYYFQALALQLP